MAEFDDSIFRYVEPITRLRHSVETYTQKLKDTIKAHGDRPYAIYLFTRNYNTYSKMYWWHKVKKSSYKHKGEALRRAGVWRLTLSDANTVIKIRYFNPEKLEWETVEE